MRRFAALIPLIIFSLLSWQHSVSAATRTDLGRTIVSEIIPAATLRADFANLYERLQAAHADIFVHRNQADYDQRFADVMATLKQPMTLFEAKIVFQKFVAYGNVAHANIAFPEAEFEAFQKDDGRTFPVYFRIVNGRVFVGKNYSGNKEIQVGDEILSLNGVAVSQWLERTAAHVSADTPYIAHSLLEFTFAKYLWLELGEVSRFTLATKADTHNLKEVTIEALSRDEQRQNAGGKPKVFSLDSNARKARLLDDNIAYLRPGPFYNIEDPNDLWNTQSFLAFIDDAFRTFVDSRARNLVIDLRQNPGGDNSFSDPMLAWIATGPFRFCSSFVIRSSDEAAAANQTRLDNNPEQLDSISKLFATKYASVPRGETFQFEIPEALPRKGQQYDGRVYVLVDRHSYSNSVNVAAIVQDYELGIVAGEKTSDMATTYGAMEHFTLPATQIRVGFPKAHIIRPSGDTRADGVTPDWPFAAPIVAENRDVMLDNLLNKIRDGMKEQGSSNEKRQASSQSSDGRSKANEEYR